MKVILIGGFSEIIELCEDCGLEVIGYIDEDTSVERLTSYQYSLLGSDENFLYAAYKDNTFFFISPDSPSARKKIFQKLHDQNLRYVKLISPHSKVSRTAVIGQGSCLQYGTNVSSSCVIGDFVKINTFANIMHDSLIGDFSTIAPNAAIMGRVKIGRSCYIGANATVIPEITICDNAIVGAGAVICKDVHDPGTYVGVPARKI